MNIFSYPKERANQLALTLILALVVWTSIVLLFTRIWSDTFPGVIGYVTEGLLLLILGYVLFHPDIGRKHIFKKLQNPINFAFLLFIGFALISMFINNVPLAQGVLGVRAIFQFILLTIIVLLLDIPESWVKRLFHVILGMAVIQSIVGIGQVILGVPLPLTDMEGRRSVSIGEEIRAFGFMDSSNTLAAFIIVAVLLTVLYIFMYRSQLNRKSKILYIVLLSILMIALTLTFSRQAFLALIGCFGLLGLLFRKNKAFKIMLISSATLLVLFIVGYGLAMIFLEGFAQRNLNTFDLLRNYRVLMILSGLMVFTFNPIFGVGPGMFGSNAAFFFNSPFHEFMMDDIPDDMTTVDNNALYVFVEYGIIGTILFLYLFFRIFKLMISMAESLSPAVLWISVFVLAFGIAFLLMGTLSTVWENQPISIFFWLFLGIAVNWYNRGKTAAKET
ncbi:O-antigen ligase [Geomicrobium halophilum]|uniref:O-antigen ligase n=1 Tax=Geomicrobium halophilum TaxID=549000 RepID=A0A841PNQ5_9BACL|nr:O-antigen ligase family protein [Geomicrobium halophilum]MBB6450389.1 O-antigen ligase [Geomicrobium halophilum]